MTDFHLPATTFTPAVLLSPERGLLTLTGESYPENVLSFYAPLLERVRALVEENNPARLQVEMRISYYNSASAKAFQRIFQLLNRAGEAGCAVTLVWNYDQEDDMARDLGNNIREDFPGLDFVDSPLAVV